ncbi:hypothetical protein [Candidatus Entotheonella palauensis]|nr:hypothetical protein [Candidatus Entotheonella palauensis]
MTVEEIDRKLESWGRELQVIAANIHDLEALTAYQLLQHHSMTGISAQRADEAVAAVEALWSDWGLIHTAIQTAQEKRATLPQVFGRAQVISEIEMLVLSPSITLPPEHIPPHQRHISAAATRERMISLDALKREMNVRFQALNAILKAFQDAWHILERVLTASKKKVKSVETQALTLCTVLPAEIAGLSRQLEAMQQRWHRDPLSSAKTTGNDLKPYLTAALQAVRDLERQHETFATDIEHAWQMLEQLNALRVQALKWQKEAAQAGYPAGDIPSNKTLQTTLSEIQQAFESTNVAFVTSGLETWWQESQRRKQQLESYIKSIETLVQERQQQQELTARLKTAHQNLEDLRNLRVEGLRLHKACLDAIQPGRACDPMLPGSTKALQDDLDDIAVPDAEASLDVTAHMLAALSAWEQQGHEMKRQFQQVIEVNQSLLNRLHQFNERWQEALSKTTTYSAQGLEVKGALATFKQRIEQLLLAEQVDLGELEKMLYAYETRLGEEIARL